MNITIVGTGNMGRGIGARLVAGGHAVTFVGRNAAKAEALAAELGVATADLAAGLRNDVVVLALPYDAALDFARTNAAALAGKTVIDITNPLNAAYDGLVTGGGKSAGEELAALLPGAKVVKAFNTTFAGTLVDGKVAGQPLDVFIAGDDVAAKTTVIALVRDGGLNAIDAGPLPRARELEGLALLGITLQGPLGLGFQSGWKLAA